MFLRIDRADWYPDQLHAADNRARHASTDELEPGTLVIYERKPYRVQTCDLDNPLNWPDSTRERWTDDAMPDPATWHRRPFTLSLRHEPQPESDLVWLSAIAGYQWWKLPEHYAVCRLCGQLPPCTHIHTEAVMQVESKKMDLVMAIMPGCCHACREPVTTRQKTIRFEGANLMRPDLPDGSAIFHLREACHHAAVRYDARWAAAEPLRRRRLYCEGRRRNHYDGTADCTEGAQCPGKVGHRSEEWHRPVGGSAYTSGCWCVSGDLTARLAEPSESGPR
jgi:hypothetical protein